jgi:hypothetical protein
MKYYIYYVMYVHKKLHQMLIKSVDQNFEI